VGRASIKLVAEGKLPKPKHTIHFLWVPEISGTHAWLTAHPDIARRVVAGTSTWKAAYALQAAQRRTPASEPSMTAEEREASTLSIECVNGGSFSGCSLAPGAAGGRGGGPGGGGPSTGSGQGGGGGRGALGSGLPQHMTAEAAILLGQKKTALEFRDFLAGEFDPLPLADVMTYLRARTGGSDQARAREVTCFTSNI
jgi:aminopeptidase YwaD